MTAGPVHVVDDDELARNGTSRLLAVAGFDVQTYASAADFLNSIGPEPSGCMVLDVRLPDQSGLDLQAALAARDIALPIIFMTGYAEIPDTVRAIQHGALDFLTKPVDPDVLLTAVSRALALDASTRAARTHQRTLRLRYERLTGREREVFLHLIGGQLNKQVAADLQITERTIKQHRARILEKLEVTSMAEMVRLAVDLGLEPLESG